MFGKEKQPDGLQSDWITQFETERWSDDELAIARLLHNARPPLPNMPQTARQRLRQRLITRHSRQHNPFYIALRYAMSSATVVALVGLFVFAMNQLNSLEPEQWSPFQIPVVEKILPASQLLYEQATVTKEGNSSPMFSGLPLYDEATIESWYTPDFSSLRYQITNRSGQIVYFEEWHDDRWIYSIYDFSTQAKVLSTANAFIQPQLLETKIDEAAKKQMMWNDVSWLLDGFMAVDWMRLNLLIKNNQSRCTDPFCLLGVVKTDGRWQCDPNVCTRKLSETGGVKIELDRAHSDNKNYVIYVSTFPYGSNDRFRLLIDQTSLKLVELAEREWDGRKGLVIRANDTVSSANSPANDKTVFDKLPETLPMMASPTFRLWQPLSAKMRYQLKSTSPASGASIHQPTEVKAVIEYAVSQYTKHRTFNVGLTARDQMLGQPMWQENSAEAEMTQPEGILTFTFTIDPSNMRSTLWDLEVISSIAMNGILNMDHPKISWCVDCDMKTYPVIELSGMSPMPDKVAFSGKTTVADGTCLYSQLFLQYRDSMGGKPMPWWNSGNCVKVKYGYWQIDIDRKTIPADAQSIEQIYSLKLWSSDSPQHPTFFWIGTLTSPEVFGSR